MTNECFICRGQPAAENSAICDVCARGEHSAGELRAEILKLAASGLSEPDIVMRLSDIRMARFHQKSVAGPANPAELAGLRGSFEAFYRLEVSQQALSGATAQQ